MFILRKIGGLNRPTSPPKNYILGKNYTYYNAEMHPKEFNDFYNKMESDYLVREGSELYCFVFGESGEYFPLFSNERNFIMTDKGTTFENLTMR